MKMKVNEDVVTGACDAVRAETGFEPGAEIKTGKLHEALGLEQYPARNDGEGDRAYLKRCRRNDMKAIAPIEALRSRLLKTHKVDLRANGRGAYRITPPGVQAPQAARDGVVKARKALREAQQRIEHVDISRLDARQRAEREAAQLTTAARLMMLSGRTTSQVLDEARTQTAKTDRAPMPMPPLDKSKRP
jgi:hypothetical protein